MSSTLLPPPRPLDTSGDVWQSWKTWKNKVSGLVLVGPNNPAVGKEALSSPRSFYANVTPQDLVEHVEDITMEGAFKFSNFVPRSFAEQLLTQSDTHDMENPFYVMDIDDLFYKMDLWQKAIPRVKPYYAVKCNNNLTILQVFVGSGLGFDCASVSEIETMLSLGVEPSRIIYAHTQKHVSFIRRAKEAGVDLMTFDSAEELHKIKQHHPAARLVLRLKVDNDKAWSVMSDKFGCSDGEAVQMLHLANDLELTIVGVSFHVGSGNQDPNAFAGAIAGSRRAFDAGRALGFHMTLLDIGGGYPGKKRDEPVFHKTALIINDCLDKYFPESYGAEIISEPGAFFVASAMTLFTKIIGKRISEGHNKAKPRQVMYYLNDSMYKSFMMCLYDDNRIEPQLLKTSDGPLHQSVLWGITCDGMDKIRRSCDLPDLSVGDWLMFENMGAYTITLNTQFNGFPSPDIYYRASKIIS